MPPCFRIVPTVRDIGLWGPKVQEAFAAMGAIGCLMTIWVGAVTLFRG
jgi:hypothetical protein